MAQFNDGKHIENIIQRRPCPRHSAARGVACFAIPSGQPFGPEHQIAICNDRAVKAGANAEISQDSRSGRTKRVKA